MSPESFMGKVLISVIDKLLIGLAVSGLALYFQYTQREAQLVNQQRLAIGSVWTDEVTDLRGQLTENVAVYQELIDELMPIGQARDGFAKRLDEAQGDIDGTVSLLRRFHTFIPEREGTACYPRKEAVLEGFTAMLTNELTLPLLTERMEPVAVQEKLEEAIAGYMNVLTFVRCLALDAFQYEISVVPQ